MALDTNFVTNVLSQVNDLTTAEKVKLNEAIFEEIFELSNIRNSHRVVTGVRDGQLQVVVGRDNPFGALSATTAGCTMNNCDLDTNYSARPWSLGNYNCRIPLCIDSLNQEFLTFWEVYKQGLDNPLETPDAKAFIEFVIERVKRKSEGAVWRVSYLGDKDSANSLINNNIGLYVQAQSGDGQQIEITEVAPTPQELYDYLNQAYTLKSVNHYFDPSKYKFVLTYAYAAQLALLFNEAKDKSIYNCNCIDPNAITGARTYNARNFTLFGMQVDVHAEIDGSKAAIGDNVVYEALLVNKSDLLIGTELESRLSQFEIFYDKKDRKIYIDTMVNVGSMLATDDYVYISPNANSGS